MHGQAAFTLKDTNMLIGMLIDEIFNQYHAALLVSRSEGGLVATDIGYIYLGILLIANVEMQQYDL